MPKSNQSEHGNSSKWCSQKYKTQYKQLSLILIESKIFKQKRIFDKFRCL